MADQNLITKGLKPFSIKALKPFMFFKKHMAHILR